MAKVEIYTSPLCGFCYQAKTLLNTKGVDFDEVDILAYPDRKPEMMARANGRHTVPQIFINNAHIGGCDDIYGLDSEGKLDPLLTA
ncbi:MAG: glutaredoxin 3 [Rhodospirillales bacterium]|nr:glutaredoxin 3 [Rhodospirillales bacterium]